MKIYSIILVAFATVVFASCQKAVQQPTNAIQATSGDETTTEKRTNLQLLCAHTWKYQKYYTGYIDLNNFGTLVYKRGAEGNTINLDVNRVTFHTDGTVEEIDQNGNSVSGTWYFTDANQNAYVVTNSYGSFPTTIMLLSGKKFVWNGSGVAGFMAPDQQ